MVGFSRKKQVVNGNGVRGKKNDQKKLWERKTQKTFGGNVKKGVGFLKKKKKGTTLGKVETTELQRPRGQKKKSVASTLCSGCLEVLKWGKGTDDIGRGKKKKQLKFFSFRDRGTTKKGILSAKKKEWGWGQGGTGPQGSAP